MASEAEIEAAAAAIANSRGARHGAPALANILEMLVSVKRKGIVIELLSDARAALEAAEQIRAVESNRAAPGVESPTAEGR